MVLRISIQPFFKFQKLTKIAISGDQNCKILLDIDYHIVVKKLKIDKSKFYPNI